MPNRPTDAELREELDYHYSVNDRLAENGQDAEDYNTGVVDALRWVLGETHSSPEKDLDAFPKL